MLTIDWKPNKTSSIPLYKQIIDYIKRKIANGDWIIGSKLPTQRELAKAFRVNRSTIVEALDELKAEGLIEGKSTKGTIIVNNTWSLLASISPPNWQDYIEGGVHRPNLETIQLINKLEFEPNMIRLGTGELSPDLFPNERMKKVFKNLSEKVHSLGYLEPKGLQHLREIISQYLKKYGIHASPASILITSGGLQALQLISIGILQPGSTIFVEKPSYIKSLHVFESTGMKLTGLSMDRGGIKPSEIKRNNKNTTLLYTIPTFHNPTSIVMPEDRREKILKICEKERLPIIEDDVYRELWLDEMPPLPLKTKDKNGTVLYLGSTSKTLAPGFRIGWLVGPEPVVERLGDIKMQTDYGSSSLSQWAIAEWIESGLYEENLLEVREKLKLRRQIALNALEKNFSDIALWEKPKGGFYIWLTLKEKISMNKLFHMAWRKRILINPGYMYDFSNNQSLRISYAYASLKDLEKGLEKLSIIIRELIKEK
ncbi:PLP-dependent aminotransferase family protein [Crassaminicella profunda]|uniref:aminotransferase-like domain-containing protein n=1 Tax=Crassaminicella profunda TaxID=1286698 RepID=UPI001CA6956C|nr:PLP-dependent aminotransferase family protein [Crassaminicella profunda]QZY55182.1 PLP-dependent aminotransferase family protein [Crassaminicella profunda]